MKKLIIIISLLLIASPLFAQTDIYYYVAPSYGDNSNWGESSALAYETLDFCTDFVPNYCNVHIWVE